MDVISFGASPDAVSNFQKSRSKSQKKQICRLDLPQPDGGKFVRGPIPLDWLRAANTCGRRSISVAVLLWYGAAWQKSNPFKLSRDTLAELAVSPRTARRVLERMKSIGIVEVEFHRGRSPLVTILALPTSNSFVD
jgi:hypothetical protein